MLKWVGFYDADFSRFSRISDTYFSKIWEISDTDFSKKIPIEVKANTKGSMQSLWIFMSEHGTRDAVRTSLENFGEFSYHDPKAEGAERHVRIVPLYALRVLGGFRFFCGKVVGGLFGGVGEML